MDMDYNFLFDRVRSYPPYSYFKQVGDGDFRDTKKKNPSLKLSVYGLYDFKEERMLKSLTEVALELGIELDEVKEKKEKIMSVVDIYNNAEKVDSIINAYYKTRGLELSNEVITDIGFRVSHYQGKTEIINPIKNVNGQIVSLNRVEVDNNGNKLSKKKLGSSGEPNVTCFGDRSSKYVYCFEGLEDALSYKEKLDSSGLFLVVYSAGCWKNINPFIEALNRRSVRNVRVILDPDDNCVSLKQSMKIEQEVERFVPLLRFDCNTALQKGAINDWHKSLQFAPKEGGGGEQGENSLIKDMLSFDDVMNSKEAGFVPILNPILNERECCMLFAKQGSGKSFISQRLAMCAASGAKFLKWKFERPYKTAYLDGEMGIDTIKERSLMMVKTLGVPMLQDNLFFLTTKEDGSTRERNISNLNVQAQFDELFKKVGIEIFIIDNLMTTALPENSKDDDMKVWERIQPWIIGLKARGVTVILVHHTNKGGEEPRGDIKKDVIVNSAIKLSPCPFEVGHDGSHISWEFWKTRSFYGSDGDPIYIKNVNTPEGSLEMHYEDYNKVVEKEVVKHLGQGVSVQDISSKLGVPKWRINEIKKTFNAEPSTEREDYEEAERYFQEKEIF